MNSKQKSTKILIVADSKIPIPPIKYGGTERVVDYLANQLVNKGYSVTLMAAPGSKFKGKLVTYPNQYSSYKLIRIFFRLFFWLKFLNEIKKNDIVHSFIAVKYALPAFLKNTPLVQNFQWSISREEIEFLKKYNRDLVTLVAVGNKIIEKSRDIKNWHTVHNAVPVKKYKYYPKPSKSKYLIFLGRISEDKGVYEAIEIAKKAKIKLIIAGNISNQKDKYYFEKKVKPYINGKNIVYVGEVDDKQKNKLLGNALALLNPTQCEEAFGLVNIEALSCGTPVISSNRGELPNTIESEITGFLCKNEKEFLKAIENIEKIDRKKCREEAELRFDIPGMVAKYEKIYIQLLEQQKLKNKLKNE